MKILKVDIELGQAEEAIRKLVDDISSESNVEFSSKTDFWEICEQLNRESFIALKKNVYFADFLRSINVSLMSEENLADRDYGTLGNGNSLGTALLNDAPDDVDKSVSQGENVLTFEQPRIPSLATKLDVLKLPSRFLKLIKRLQNISSSHASFHLGSTLGELVMLEISEVASLPGVGASYVETFKELKLLINTTADVDFEQDSTTFCEKNFDFSEENLSNFRLCLSGVDSKFSKALEKYARHIFAEDLAEKLGDILKFNRKSLLELPGFGAKVVDHLIEFKGIVSEEIESVLAGKTNYQNLESSLIVPKVFSDLDLSKIEEVLLSDIDAFLERIEEGEVNIIQKRWGFIEDKQTLEEIAISLDVTRERVRQKELKINNEFIQYLRINQNAFWSQIEPELSVNLSERLKDIYSCFSTEKDFYEFLSLICGQRNLYEYVYPPMDKSALNLYFAEYGAPRHISDVKEFIAELNLSYVRNVDNAVQQLVQQGAIAIEGEHIWPRQIDKAEACACVLFDHDKGLPWLDVSKLVNNLGYSKTSIYEDRLDIEAFKLPEYIYLAGKGIYKHTRFIDSELTSLDDIFIEILEYAESCERDVFQLIECYQTSSTLQEYDYFVIRHFVKRFGEDFGLYFDGRSQADSVGLEKGFKKTTQKDVIVEAMNRNEKPLTKTDIANLLKSKSRDHASFYLHGLIDEGRVVQVDRMVYTTPTLAYRNIVLENYADAIDEVLERYEIPTEPSILKEELNSHFLTSYSKYFYASIARLYAERKGWFRQHSLYSKKKIQFKNLNSVIEQVCRSELSQIDNVTALQKHVAITPEAAAIAIRNWKNSP